MLLMRPHLPAVYTCRQLCNYRNCLVQSPSWASSTDLSNQSIFFAVDIYLMQKYNKFFKTRTVFIKKFSYGFH